MSELIEYLASSTPPDPSQELAEIAADAGLARVEMVAWRDLGHPEAGGSELHAANVAERWADAGIDVSLTVSRASGSPRTTDRGGVRVVRRAGRYTIFPVSALSGLARRRRSKPDGVVEIWNGMPFFSPLWAADCARTVWLHHVHDGMWDMTLPLPLARFGRMLELRVAPRLYRHTPIVTLSESSRQTIVDRLGFAPSMVEVVHPGVDDRFTPGGRRSAHPLFVAVGRLMASKRFDLLIDAMFEVHRSHPTVEAVIVGDGRERDALQQRIDALGAGGWLRLAGRLDDAEVVALYRKAWAVVSTSAFEGWGLTLTEAAACGTPAVASRIAGHLDAVRDRRSGLLFDGREDLESALTAIVERPVLRARLSAGALQRAAELSWDQTALGTLRSLGADARRRQQRALKA